MIIDQHDVEIGTSRHFAAAEFAHAEDDAGTAPHHAMLGRHFCYNRLQQTFQDHGGNVGEGLACFIRADRLGKDTNAGAELLLAGKDARLVHHLFEW